MDLVAKRLAKHGMSISYDQAVANYLSRNGTDEKNGARPLARLISDEVVAPIADLKRRLRREHGSSEGYHIIISAVGELKDESHRKERQHLEFEAILQEVA